jgi:hypothetical protein
MNRTQVFSSSIRSIGYENGILEIGFVDGGVYQYSGVPESIYQGLLNAPSKGKFFHAFIKDCFPTNKVGW